MTPSSARRTLQGTEARGGVFVCIDSLNSLAVNRQHNPLVTAGQQHLQHLGAFPDFSYDLGQIA